LVRALKVRQSTRPRPSGRPLPVGRRPTFAPIDCKAPLPPIFCRPTRSSLRKTKSPPKSADMPTTHMRSLSIPGHANSDGIMNPIPGARFEGPRSPPSTSFPSPYHRRLLECQSFRPALRMRLTDTTKDTSHVPCKFFRQGACQAGAACPFSHDISSAAETVCKYFAKVCLCRQTSP